MKRFLPKSLLLLLALGTATDGFALETAQTLPRGVRRMWVVGITSSAVDRRYSGDGRIENIAVSNNRTLTMRDFEKSEPKLKILVRSLNEVEPGLGDRLEAYSNVYNDFTIRKDILIPSFQWGITDRFTVGVRTEVVKRIVTNKLHSESVSNAHQVETELGNRAANPEALARGLNTLRAENLTPSFVAYRMYTYKGYQLPADFERTDLGDTELGAKYKFFDNGLHMSAVQSRLIVPTGKPKPFDNPYDPGSGYGAWGTTFELYHEYFPSRLLSFGAAAMGRHYFADTRTRAVPRDAEDTLPSLRAEDAQVEDVKRRSGQELRTEVATIFHIPGDLFKVWGAYQYWVKGSDDFYGTRNLYYPGLKRDTSWNIHMWEAGLRFSTISLFRRGKFRAPLELDASFNSSFAGRNIREASYGRVDMKLYF